MPPATRLLAVVVVAIAAAAPRAATVDLPVKPLVEAAARYVKNYDAALVAVLGDEATTQTATSWGPAPRSGANVETLANVAEHRATRGELFLTYLPVDGAWIAVHDVAEVDGQPVDREDMLSLLARAPLASVAAQVAARNARFNLGHITRNFNEPTLALLLFDEKRVNSVKFSHPSPGTDADGAAIVTLDFEERDRPSIVSSRTDGPLFSKGQIVLEPDSGRIRKTVLKLHHKDVTAELTTTYGPDEHVKLWLPMTFTEKYGMSNSRTREEDVCESTYSNYRKFEVSARIK